MAGNTLFRPEDRLVWYADWLKFLQEREADLRAQMARQEKSARKAEPPPEAEIAFVSDQASFLGIAFGEQASAGAAGEDTPHAEEDVAITDNQPVLGDNDEGAPGAATLLAGDASEDDEGAVVADEQAAPGSSKDALDFSNPQTNSASEDSAPHVEKEVVADGEEEFDGVDEASLPAEEIPHSPAHPLPDSSSLSLSPSQTEEGTVDEEPPQSPPEKEELA